MQDTPDSPYDFDKLLDIVCHIDDFDFLRICRKVRIDFNRLNGDSQALRAYALVDRLEKQNRLPELEKALHNINYFNKKSAFDVQNSHISNSYPKGLDKLRRPADKRKLSPQEKFKLVDKLLECNVIKEKGSRQTVVHQLLSPEISIIIDNPNDRIHITNLVDKCLDYLWGLEQLIEVVRYYESDLSPVEALESLLQQIYPRTIKLSLLRILKHILEETSWPIEILMRLYIQVYEESLANGWLPSEEHNEYEKRAFILDCLAAAPMKDKNLPIITFVEHLIAYLNERLAHDELQLQNNTVQLLQDKLKSWIHTTVEEHHLEKSTIYDLHAPVSSRSPRYLLVKFRTNSDEKSFFVQAWLLDSKYTTIDYLYVNDDPLEVKDIPNLISDLLNKSYQYLTSKDVDQLVVEFSLPNILLFEDVDHWLVKIGASVTPVKIGVQHQVVVRAYDRISEKRSLLFWKSRWESLSYVQKNDKSITPFVICDPEDCDNHESIHAKLRRTHVACLVLTLVLGESASKNIDIINAILDAGIPIALWSRQRTHEPKQLKTMFEALLSQHNLFELPQLVWDQRLDAVGNRDEQHLGHRLTLLLDDPSRLPPDEQEPSDVEYYFDIPK